MPRSLSSPMLTALQSDSIIPVFLADISFANGVVSNVWSGVGNFVWNGNTYLGVGSFGKVGNVEESVEVKAIGTSLTLSGIDSTLLHDCLSDIQVGAPVTLWFALFNPNATLIGSPYPLFVGTVDKPAIKVGPDTVSISLALESKLYNLQRPTARRYTSADQRLYYPDDTGFGWVERLNDSAWLWGG